MAHHSLVIYGLKSDCIDRMLKIYRGIFQHESSILPYNKGWQWYNVYIYYASSYSKCIHNIFATLYWIDACKIWKLKDSCSALGNVLFKINISMQSLAPLYKPLAKCHMSPVYVQPPSSQFLPPHLQVYRQWTKVDPWHGESNLGTWVSSLTMTLSLLFLMVFEHYLFLFFSLLAIWLLHQLLKTICSAKKSNIHLLDYQSNIKFQVYTYFVFSYLFHGTTVNISPPYYTLRKILNFTKI